jgi:drug/metabolite transporter (DMT)-like permease
LRNDAANRAPPAIDPASSAVAAPQITRPVRKDHLDALAVGLLLACCVFWGFQQVLVKATLPEMAPLFQVSLRFAGATLVLALWCRCRGVALLERDGSLAAGLLAGALFAAEFAAIYMGLQHTSASRLTVFLYTAPFWVAALLPLFVRSERLRPLQWLGMACAFLAVAFALSGGLVGGSAQAAGLQGDLLGLAAGLFWGLTTVVIRSTRLANLGAEKLLFYQVAISALILPLISIALGERWQWQFSAFAWGSLALQTVVGAFVSYLAWMWMLGRYPATKISSFVFLTPLFALLFGALWLGEAVTLELLAALGFVALGIVLVNRR